MGHYNRAQKMGLNVYCSRACAGIGRRSGKTKEDLKAEKQAYDKEYKQRKYVKDRQRHRYAENPPRDKEKIWRKNRAHKHAEYCRAPKYKEYKKAYDEQYWAKKNYGEFWESAIILQKIEKEVDKHEAYRQKGTNNKSQKRKRAWKSLQQTISRVPCGTPLTR